jgi:hypothetical protein
MLLQEIRDQKVYGRKSLTIASVVPRIIILNLLELVLCQTIHHGVLLIRIQRQLEQFLELSVHAHVHQDKNSHAARIVVYLSLCHDFAGAVHDGSPEPAEEAFQNARPDGLLPL